MFLPYVCCLAIGMHWYYRHALVEWVCVCAMGKCLYMYVVWLLACIGRIGMCLCYG